VLRDGTMTGATLLAFLTLVLRLLQPLKQPERGEIDTPVQEQLIVELYSK
jgi:hypothetical protein